MTSELFIDSGLFETRVALKEDDKVVELFVERLSELSFVGNVYLGRVIKVLPGMDAAFIDIGLEKAAFLHVDDIDKELADSDIEAVTARKKDIRSLLHEGEKIIVQVAKNPIGTKGARLTSYISIPGRYLVMMPTEDHVGVSRRIEDEKERKRLKNILDKARKDGHGYIARTVCEGRDENELVGDMTFLSSLWADIKANLENAKAPELLHKDLDLSLRVLRDMINENTKRIVFNSRSVFDKTKQFAKKYMSHLNGTWDFYNDKIPMFEAFGIEEEFRKVLSSRVWLKSGGYIIINETEALVSIDVNTGRYTGKQDLERTALKTNLEAAKVIARQLRLRNMGGIIVIDFIDMEKEEHRKKVESAFYDEVKDDKARTNLRGLSRFGLLEMTRKRTRVSITRQLTEECYYCHGTGLIESRTTVVHEIIRKIENLAKSNPKLKKLFVTCHFEIMDLLKKENETLLQKIRDTYHVDVDVNMNYNFHITQYEVLEKSYL